MRQDTLRRLEELKKQFAEMRTADAFRSVQQMQARLRIETPWVCTNYYFPHELVLAGNDIYEELKVQRSPYFSLYVCTYCLGVQRKHQMFRFINNIYPIGLGDLPIGRGDLPIGRGDLPPFPNIRDVTT